MKYHQLDIAKKQSKKRVGRGIGSGYGKTAGRGTKGQNARTGGGVRPGFEGGQNPLMKRLPKTRGFKSSRREVAVIHTDQLDKFKANSTVDKEQLRSAGLIKDTKQTVKLLYRGDIKKSLTVTVDKASTKAVAAIESANGSFKKAD